MRLCSSSATPTISNWWATTSFIWDRRAFLFSWITQPLYGETCHATTNQRNCTFTWRSGQEWQTYDASGRRLQSLRPEPLWNFHVNHFLFWFSNRCRTNRKDLGGWTQNMYFDPGRQVRAYSTQLQRADCSLTDDSAGLLLDSNHRVKWFTFTLADNHSLFCLVTSHCFPELKLTNCREQPAVVESPTRLTVVHYCSGGTHWSSLISHFVSLLSDWCEGCHTNFPDLPCLISPWFPWFGWDLHSKFLRVTRVAWNTVMFVLLSSPCASGVPFALCSGNDQSTCPTEAELTHDKNSTSSIDTSPAVLVRNVHADNKKKASEAKMDCDPWLWWSRKIRRRQTRRHQVFFSMQTRTWTFQIDGIE